MAWINGQWVEDRPGFGGMLGGFGGQPRFAAGYTGDTSLDVIGGPMQPPPFGDRPGVPNLPPQMNPPGYSRGPQMQPLFGGGLGDITPWNPVQTPQFQPPWRPMDDLRGAGVNLGPQVRPPMPPMPPPRPPVLPPDMIFDPPAPVQRISHHPQVRPPMPPPPPTIGDVWPQVDPPPRRDTGAEDRARKLAQQKARAAAKRARDLASQKRAAANQRAATLARQKAAAAAKRAAGKAASKRATPKRKPIDQRGYGKGPGDTVKSPIVRRKPRTFMVSTDVGKGPKKSRPISGRVRTQNFQPGDR